MINIKVKSINNDIDLPSPWRRLNSFVQDWGNISFDIFTWLRWIVSENCYKMPLKDRSH